jgi:hypothetical protein
MQLHPYIHIAFIDNTSFRFLQQFRNSNGVTLRCGIPDIQSFIGRPKKEILQAPEKSTFSYFTS